MWLTFTVLAPTPSWPADIHFFPVWHTSWGIVIRGDIVPGDDQTFLNEIVRMHRENLKETQGHTSHERPDEIATVVLDSRGGNPITAIAIGRIIQMKAGTLRFPMMHYARPLVH
jgi:hypothetical protein